MIPEIKNLKRDSLPAWQAATKLGHSPASGAAVNFAEEFKGPKGLDDMQEILFQQGPRVQR